MRRVVTAIFEDGVLKPSESLPLSDHERVLLVVLSLPHDLEAESAQRAAIDAKTDAWLAARTPIADDPLMAPTPTRPDRALTSVLAATRQHGAKVDPDEIAAEVAAALVEARALPPEVAARLDAEVDAILSESGAAAD